MHARLPSSYTFGHFVLDLERHRLLHDGSLVELPSRALFVLRALVESSGTTLTKDRIAELAWPDSDASDANLMVQISKLRQVLRRDGDDDGWIRTVRGKGYRFDVRVLASPESEGESGFAAISTNEFDRALRAGIAAVYGLDPSSAKSAAAQLDRSLSLRPDDGTALSYRSLSWINQWLLGQVSGREARQRAPELARRALDRAPSLAIAHVAAGAMTYAFERDFPTSDRCLYHALEIDDQCGPAHEYLAYSMLARARFEEGRHHLRLAQWRTPSHLGLITHMGTAYYLERRYDRAVASYEAALALHPDHLYALAYCALSHALAGNFDEADVFRQRMLACAGEIPLARSICGTICAMRGAESKARDALRWLSSPQPLVVEPLLLASVETTLGEHDAAMRNLEASVENPFPALCALAVDPIWDPLRDRADFQHLLAAVNLDGIG